MALLQSTNSPGSLFFIFPGNLITENYSYQRGIVKSLRNAKHEGAAFISISLKTQIDTPCWQEPTSSIHHRFYPLNTGHGVLGTFLSKGSELQRPLSAGWWCGDTEKSVMHLYTRCQKLRTKRRILKKSLDKAGAQW